MYPIKDDNPTQTKPIVTIALIAICVCIFLYQFSLLHSENTFIINSFGMKPKELFLNPGLTNYSTVFSSMFLHGGFMHLIGNMLFYGFMEIISKMLWGILNFYYSILRVD